MKKILLLSFAVFLLCCWSVAIANDATSTSVRDAAKPSATKVERSGMTVLGKTPSKAENAHLIKNPQAAEVSKIENSSEYNAQLLSNRETPTPKVDNGIVPPPDPNVILQGGDTFASATVIPSLPYSDQGTTTGYVHDYTPNCFGSSAPDVVYSFTPASNASITASLCGSSYDTGIMIFQDNSGTQIACNDDFCGLQSQVSGVAITTGHTYYIVVSGYSTANGPYVLNVTGPCDVVCPVPNTPEGEPNCGPEYVDNYNGGCNSAPAVFGAINLGETICGTSGTFLLGGNQYRDTDWYMFTLTDANNLTITATGEFPLLMFLIQMGSPDPCVGYTILTNTTAADCQVATINYTVAAGTYVVWVGPQVFTGADCPKEYYVTLVGETPPQGPPNDYCQDVTSFPLTEGSPLVYTGDNSNATLDCPLSGYREVWMSFTTTECMNVTLNTCGTVPAQNWLGTWLMADCPCSNYFGANLYDWTTCGDGNWTMTYNNLPPGTYWYPFLSDPAYNPTGPYTLNISGVVCPQAPPNDICGDVVPVPISDGQTLTFSGDNTGAQSDCPMLGAPEVWEAVSTQECMNITVEYCGTPGPWGNVYIVMTDCPCGTLFFANNWAQSCTDGNWTVNFINVPAGDWYIPIINDPFNGSVGPYTINVTANACPAPPDNDDCANAQTVGEVTDLPFSTLSATFDGAGACMSSPNIWYEYISSITGPVTVSLCGSFFDTKLAVYDVCPNPPTPPNPVPLQGGEDINSATPIPGPLPVAYTGTTTGYIHDYAPYCLYSSAPDVVYSYVAPSNGTIDVSLCGTSWDTGILIMDSAQNQIACNDDYCGLQSQVNGVPVVAGQTYYIVVSGYYTYSGPYTLTVLGAAYTMLGCNDDFCSMQSQLTFDAIQGTEYIIEVGGYGSSIGDGFLTISVPMAHDVGLTGLSSPRAGALLDGVTPMNVVAKVKNFGLATETFDVMATDDHGFASIYSGLTLVAGEEAEITFPNTYLPTSTCVDYNFNVTTLLAGDGNPANDAINAVLRVARTPDENFVNDNDNLVNAYYFFAADNISAAMYTADADKEIVYVSARTYVDELGFPWPDATADPFKLYLFLDTDLDGMPDAAPVAEVTVLPTGVSPSVSYAVLNCGVGVATGDNFWVAFGQIDDAALAGSEGLGLDDFTDVPLAKWYRLAGAWTQGELYTGDEMLRAYAITPLAGGCQYVVGDINGSGGANGIDVSFGVVYFKGGNPPPINCFPACPNVSNPFYAAGDVNGNCAFNGIDITFFVNYLKGLQPALLFCPDCPPALQAVGKPATPSTEK